MKPAAMIAAPDFNLDLTLESGQVFHWRKQGRGYAGVIGRKPLFVEQDGETLLVSAGCEALASRYFALDHPLPDIYRTFPSDPTMTTALETCRGLRIIRQPAWECLATFITSSLKQVPHIRQISHAIREAFGSPVRLDGETLHAYPTAEELSRATEEELRACRLGYRAKHLLATARVVASGGIDLAEMETMDDESALARLCELPGVGPKIANCVLLFAFGRLRAFPIDVWIGRVLKENYFKRKRNVTEKRMQLFSNTYFGEFGGYAQQYLFHHARTAGK
jgi:N-glycosylase/DNA lyase